MDVSSNLDAHEHRDTSSLDSHRDASNSHSSIERKMVPIEPQVRLTIHQNQMRSFGEEFPADLITPTKYHLPQNFEETPRLVGDTSTDQTPTQADFPKGVIANGVRPANPIAAEEAIKKTERRGPASTLWLDTVGTAQDHNFNGPASPDYALRPQQEPEEDALDKDLAHGRQDGQKQFNSLSFIQFDPVPSEDLALNVPVTPKRISIVHDRSDSGASSRGEMQDSESSFTDYPAAEDFGALSSKSFEPDSLHRHERSVSATSHSHQNAGESLEASRHISQSSTSTTSKISALDSVKQQLSGQVNETVIDDTAAADQNALESQENTEIDSTNVLKQDSISGDARESNETHSYIKQSWHPNRRSLLGLGSNAKDTSTFPAKTSRGPKFSLISSMRKRTATDLSDYQAGQLQQSAMTDNESTTVQQVTTIVNRTVSNTSERRYGEKGRKKRFSGFSSFISKAKPHVSSMGNSIRGRSPTLFGPAVGSKIVNTSEIHEANPLARSKDDLSTRGIQYQTQQHRTASVDHDSGSMAKSSTHASGDQPKNPSAYIRNYTSIPDINSNQGVIISRITAPPQQGIDYKTVYSPEFFGDQPPEGYYGPEEDLETQARQPETTTVAVATRKPAAAPIKTFDPEASAVVANLSLNLDTSRPREKEQSRIVGSDQPRPPPLPPKDYPHHSVTTTTTTNHILNGPTRTTTEVGIGQSQQAHYESRLRGRQHEASNTDVFVITKNIPGSPLVHKAKTRTVTRVLNGRSNSPSSRNPKTRSSLPIVPPLNIHKRPSIPQDETRRVRKESVDSQVATAAVISAQNRGIIPHLTLDTRTAPNRPVPVEQFSGVQNAVHEPDLSATSHALINTPSHPFIARRAVSSQGQASGTTIEDHTLASNPNPSRTLDRDINPRKENDTHPLTARAISGRDKKESNFLALEDPVMIVPPLTIRKSPEPSIKRSPVPGSQAITKIPSQDGPTSVLRKAPPIPLPSVPSRLSLHSPVLKDSPTLPRPTPPSSSRAASRMMPPLPQTPHSLTKSPLTEGKEVVLPPERAVSPLPRKKASSTVRSMTPVEKMKDEPGVNEVLKEKDESEEEIIMSSTAYPGQEWRPDYGYDGWDGSE